MRNLACSFMLLLAGCSGVVSNPPADSGVPLDAGPSDAGPDAGPGADAGGTDAGGFDGGAPSPCEPLAAAAGTVVRVTPGEAANLPSIVSAAAAGTTVLLADGTYPVPSSGLSFLVPGVTLRSESGVPQNVVLDGAYSTPEILRIQASDITIAELTLTRAVDHPAHVSPAAAADITGARFYRVRLVDGGEQFLKINSNGGGAYADFGIVECSSFELTDSGRPHIERNPGGCYTGGIDGHGARGWVVRRNTFKSIYCSGEGLAEHAVHFWTGSRDTLVEQNLILNCARGVGFGLGSSVPGRTYSDSPYPQVVNAGHYGGIVRNNFIWANHSYFDTGIGLEQAPGAAVLHNTVVSTQGGSFFSSIDYRFATPGAVVRNNLTVRITARDGATATVDHNLESTPTASFVSFASADLHLVAGAAAAVDQGAADPKAGLDIDGKPHDRGPPDLGAHEFR